LTVNFYSLQTASGQLSFGEPQKRKVRPVAQDRLEPAVPGEKFAHPRRVKFYNVKRQHGDMLRSARRRD
jgi:hypothetical protein